MNITLVLTCSACPEQYDAYDEDGKQVGYLRLRHGEFSVRVPDARGIEVYHASPEGDGMFEPHERQRYLDAAKYSIRASLVSGVFPAGELHTAAQHMVEHHGPSHPRHEFWRELAEWLDDRAALIQQATQVGNGPPSRALRIARAYMLSLESEQHA